MSNDNRREAERLIPIATVTPISNDLKNVEEALNEAKIYFVMEGSRAYQISVRPEDVVNAVEILKRSKAGDKITFC